MVYLWLQSPWSLSNGMIIQVSPALGSGGCSHIWTWIHIEMSQWKCSARWRPTCCQCHHDKPNTLAQVSFIVDPLVTHRASFQIVQRFIRVVRGMRGRLSQVYRDANCFAAPGSERLNLWSTCHDRNSQPFSVQERLDARTMKENPAIPKSRSKVQQALFNA